MPPAVKEIGVLGGNKYYRTKDDEWHDEAKARDMKITHSTLPTKNKHK